MDRPGLADRPHRGGRLAALPQNPGSPPGRRAMNTWLLIRRLRGPAFIILVGVTALLNQWGVLSFSRSWPLYLILAGVIGLAERAALANAPQAPLYPAAYAPQTYPPAAARRPIAGPPQRRRRAVRVTPSPIPAGGPSGHPAPTLFAARRCPGAALLSALAPPAFHARAAGADRGRRDRAAGRDQQVEPRPFMGLVYPLVAAAVDWCGIALPG